MQINMQQSELFTNNKWHGKWFENKTKQKIAEQKQQYDAFHLKQAAVVTWNVRM